MSGCVWKNDGDSHWFNIEFGVNDPTVDSNESIKEWYLLVVCPITPFNRELQRRMKAVHVSEECVKSVRAVSPNPKNVIDISQVNGGSKIG